MNYILIFIILSLFILFLKQRFFEKFKDIENIKDTNGYTTLNIKKEMIISDQDSISETNMAKVNYGTHSDNLCLFDNNKKLCLNLDDIKTMKDTPHKYKSSFVLGNTTVNEKDFKDIKNLDKIIYEEYTRPCKLVSFFAQPLLIGSGQTRWLPGDRNWSDDWTSNAKHISYNVANDRKIIKPVFTPGKRNDSYGIMSPNISQRFLYRYDRTR